MNILAYGISAFFIFFCRNSFAITNIAEVVKVRGEVTQLSPGAKDARQVSIGDKLAEDTSILTGAKSFIKIKFLDESELNLGPESKIIISEMKKDSPGVISLLKGRMRTEVQKSTSSNENKFFVKTRTAAMGIRGTDFQTIYNPENKITSLLTYKGSVAMAKIDDSQYQKLEEIDQKESILVERKNSGKSVEIKNIPSDEISTVSTLNKILSKKETVFVPPGQISLVNNIVKRTSLPIKISNLQLNALYKNTEYIEAGEKPIIPVNSESTSNYKLNIK
jgi:hypothetical protein